MIPTKVYREIANNLSIGDILWSLAQGYNLSYKLHRVLLFYCVHTANLGLLNCLWQLCIAVIERAVWVKSYGSRFYQANPDIGVYFLDSLLCNAELQIIVPDQRVI